jgi:hypothetical protein
MYLLDTVTVSYALRGEGHVAGRITAHKPSERARGSWIMARGPRKEDRVS